jgi:CubicO group peptidase (beta-lactamase class C family)
LRQRLTRNLCVALPLLAACAPKDVPQVSRDTATSTPSSVAAPGARTTAPHVISVRATDYSFDAPREIPAGMTTFRLANDGPDLHHVQVVRLDSAKTVADLEQSLKTGGKRPAWATSVGGPNATAPKTEANATLDMQPGRYALVCSVHGPDGVAHVAKGMIQALTVTPRRSGAVVAMPPAADAVLTLRDYAFDLSTPLRRGRQTIEVRTAANTQSHEVVLARLLPGKTAEHLFAWMTKGEGSQPVTFLGGVADLVPGVSNYFTVDLAPGEYVLLCVVADAKDGKPHVMHGMVRTVTIS